MMGGIGMVIPKYDSAGFFQVPSTHVPENKQFSLENLHESGRGNLSAREVAMSEMHDCCFEAHARWNMYT
jgi:hypothetical protein